MRTLLLGLGLQGKAALHDLLASPDVKQIIVGDVNADSLAYVDHLGTDKVTPVALDVHDEAQVADLMAQVQAVICLLPPTFSVPIAKLAVAQGIHFIETTYAFPEYEALGQQAAEKGLVLLPEFGFDPGIDLVIAGQAVRDFDEVHELHSYGSGVPEPPADNNPLRYKISWSFAVLLYSYDRPARLLQDGKVVDLRSREIFEAQYGHEVEIDGIGLMEAFPNGDAIQFLDLLGITDSIHDSGRYTLRWPGHSVLLGQNDQTGLSG